MGLLEDQLLNLWNKLYKNVKVFLLKALEV